MAWKLAAVLGGQARPELLGSYGEERQPVAFANMQLSVDNFYEALRIPSVRKDWVLLGMSWGCCYQCPWHTWFCALRIPS